MCASMDYSDPLTGESQATQLLQNVLDSGVHAGSNTNHTNGPIDDPNVSKEFSSDSHSTSSMRNPSSAPHYHFHDLAATQSQSQCEDSGENGSSQKENIGNPNTSGEVKHATGTALHPSSVSYPSSSKNSGKGQLPHVDQLSHPPSCATTTKSKPTNIKAVSFQPPRAAASRPTTTTNLVNTQPVPSVPRPPTRPRVTRNSSQDSFGGAVSQDLERQFLAESKQFEVPLSELGRVSFSTQDASIEPAASTKRQPPSKSSMFAYSVPVRGPGPTPAASSHHGNVLVAATPSNSGSSQSQPSQPSQFWESPDLDSFSNRQPMDTTFDNCVNVDIGNQSQASTQTTQLSSSYERLLAGDEDTSTQIVDDYQATQLATQPDDYDNQEVTVDRNVEQADTTIPEDETCAISVDRPSDENIWITPLVPASASSTSTAPPRSLLRMVNPHKQWRVQNLAREVGVGGVHGKSGQRVVHPVLEETPISYDLPTPSSAIDKIGLGQSIGGSSRASGSSAGYPGRDLLNPKHISSDDSSFSRRLPFPTPLDHHMNEVVPDSEPPMVDQDPSMSNSVRTPLQNIDEQAPSTKNTAKRPFREIDPSSEPEAGSGEIVPDSILMEGEAEEEEDVPLAVGAMKRGRVKGNDVGESKEKGKSALAFGHVNAAMAPPASVPKGKQKAVPSSSVEGTVKQTKALKSTSRMQPHLDEATMVQNPRPIAPSAQMPSKEVAQVPGRSWETGEVPSSLPEQDGDGAAAHGKRKTETNKGKGKAAGKTNTVPNSRRTRTTTKRRRIASDTEDDDEVDNDEMPLIPKMEKEEEEETEPADEDYMDVDIQDGDSVAGPSRKPKRGAANVRANSKASKNLPRTTKSSRASATTPLARQGKRLRSVASSASRNANETPTRVFALWKQDGHYYSGTVHSHNLGTKYLVKFDDETEDVVDITRMRRCELFEGDDVILVERNQKARVVDVTQRDTKELVGVEADNGAVVNVFDVEMSDLRIATRTVTRQWTNRTLTAGSIVTVVKPKLLKSPSPSKLSVLSGNSIKSIRGKALSKTGLVVTLSVGNENWERDKDKLMTAIKSHGGTVIDDWANIFNMDGKHSQSNKRWVVHKEEVKWTGREGMERVFLLADDANLKPKYLIALALGIPCLSVNWLYDSVNEGEKDWQAYLLPQGFSEPLNARVSQFVDLDWCNSFDHLSDIMSNHVASKLFSDKSVLCFCADFVPLPKNKKTTTEAEKAKEASRMVPRIILAMGAERVEAITELKAASDNLSTFDYVVIKDSYDFVPALKNAAMCVHLPWVKDCLIAGRLLPLPEW